MKDVILDTDTFNEIDDQFALIYWLNNQDKVNIKAITAAPFYADDTINNLSTSPEDGMIKSYEEIKKILRLYNSDIPSQKGATRFMKSDFDIVESEAVETLIKTSKKYDSTNRLTVVAIGAATNIASAINKDKTFKDRVKIVWLGGSSLEVNDGFEFNMLQDKYAANVLLSLGEMFTMVPCAGVAQNLTISLPELKEYFGSDKKIGKYLLETYINCRKDHKYKSRVIWDLVATMYIIKPEIFKVRKVSSLQVTDNYQYQFNDDIKICYLYSFNRDDVWKEFFTTFNYE